MANKKFTDFNLISSAQTGDFFIGYNAVATNEVRITYKDFYDSLPSEFKYVGTDLKDLSAGWESSYTTVQENSASWGIDITQDNEVRALTANWENTYTTVNTNSANWEAADQLGSDIIYTEVLSGLNECVRININGTIRYLRLFDIGAELFLFGVENGLDNIITENNQYQLLFD